MNTQDTATQVSLLLRVRDAADQDAWNAFVSRYTPQIVGWCRRHHLQDSDAADVTQDVLIKLVRAMRTFSYSPEKGSFRAWLRTVTGNAICDLARKWKNHPPGSGDSGVLDQLQSINDESALLDLARSIEAEYERELLAVAEQRVKCRVKERTWRAFRLTTVDQMDSQQAATLLDIGVADVYVAKSRVIKMLRTEVAALEQAVESECQPHP